MNDLLVVQHLVRLQYLAVLVTDGRVMLDSSSRDVPVSDLIESSPVLVKQTKERLGFEGTLLGASAGQGFLYR